MHKLALALFYDNFWSFFRINYINIFHKTEVLMNILRCHMCLNLNWIKKYETKHNFFISVYFQFCKKKNENLWLINGYFTTISGHFSANYSKISHKTKVQMVISWMKMHYFMAILPKWILAPPKETSSHIFKMVIFPKFFGAFMKIIIREKYRQKIKLFLELFINKKFEYTFVHFISNRSLC